MDDPFLKNVFSKEIFGVRIVNLISQAYIYRLHHVSFSTNLNKFSRASGVLFHFELSLKKTSMAESKSMYQMVEKREYFLTFLTSRKNSLPWMFANIFVAFQVWHLFCLLFFHKIWNEASSLLILTDFQFLPHTYDNIVVTLTKIKTNTNFCIGVNPIKDISS